jgi:branched-chain amino acid transport system substrate-binding protein
MLRKLAPVAAVCALALLTQACGSTASGSAPHEITVGSLYPLSGPQAEGGDDEARGVQLAAEWQNAHGALHVNLKSVGTEQAESVPSAMRQLRQEGIDVVVGSHGSAISAAAAQVASETGMVFFETGAVGLTSAETAGGRNFFRLAPMGANLGQAAISFVSQELLVKMGVNRPLRYATAYVDDPYGQAVSGGAADEITRRGLQLVGTFPYSAQLKDYGPLAAQIGAAKPDVLFVTAYVDDGVALRRAMVDAHVPLVASIGTSSSYCHPAFGQALGAKAVGLFASDKPDAADVNPAALSPEGRAALAWAGATYQQRYHEAMSAPALSGFSNAYAVFVHVLPAAKSAKAKDVAAAALRVKLPEGTLANGGGVDLAPPGSPEPGANRAAASVIWEWVAPGQRAVVWPPAFATHAITPLPLAQ